MRRTAEGAGAGAAAGRRWRRVGQAVGLALLVLPLAAATLLLACVDTQPSIVRTDALSPQDLDRVRALAQRADPRASPPDRGLVVAAPARDLDLLVHEAAARLLQGAARVRLQPAAADVAVSARVPRIPAVMWINVEASLRQTPGGLPDLASLRIGRVPVPPGLATWLVGRVAERLGAGEALREGLALVEQVSLQEQGVMARYHWNPSFADSLRAALVPTDLHEPLRAANDRLASVVAVPADAPQDAVAMPRLVSAVFQLAAARTRQRIEAVGGSLAAPDARDLAIAAAENRAALITLALYAGGQPLRRVVPAARDWTQPLPRVVLVAGREDHPQHLLISAVIAAEGGGRLANAIGVLKEVADRGSGGSGFSYDDLAADRAGTRIGQRAVRDPLGLQRQLQEAAADGDLMPSIEGLPSFLDEAQYRAAIGGEGSARHAALLQLIEARVAALPVLRP